MDCLTSDVHIDEIDLTDETYRITTASPDDDLIDSIAHIGLINRPMLCRKEQGYGIVCGFRRVEALARLGRKQIPAYLLPDHTPGGTCLILSITDNRFQRQLNVVEQARAIDKLSRCIDDSATLETTVHRVLGIGRNQGLLRKLKAVARLPHQIQQLILADRLDFSLAPQLEKMDGEDLAAVGSLLSTIKLSLNKQREVIALATEIARRDGGTINALLTGDDIESILSAKEMDGNKKAAQIRKILKQQRYPELTHAEKAYSRLVKALNLPREVQVVPPRYFEGNTYQLVIHFTSLSDLQALQETLSGLRCHPILQQLLDKTFD